MNEDPGSEGDAPHGDSPAAEPDADALEIEAWAAWERAEAAAANGSEHASIMMFNLAREGQLAASLSVARTLRSAPLSADVSRRADVVIGRLWASRVQSGTDDEAREAAEQLLGDPGGLNPWQRTLLHVNLASCIQADLSADLDDVETAADHLMAALALAKTVGSSGLQATILSRLALAEIPRGRPSVASQLARAALDLAGVSLEETYGSTPLWMVRAHVALSWATYFQDEPFEWDRYPDIWIMRPEAATDPVLVSVSTQLTAWSALAAGNMQAARTAIATALVDKRYTRGGIWGPPLVVLDTYLAIYQGDRARAQEHLAQLAHVGAAADVVMVRSLIAAQGGNLVEAVALLGQITSGAVRPISVTFAAACVYEAALLEILGQHEEADASMKQALAWTEPINAAAIFSFYAPVASLELARRCVATNPGNAWAANVVRYLEAKVYPPDLPQGLGESSEVVGTRVLDTPLTPRELEVLKLISGGSSQPEIARELYVSLNTVKTHLRSIRQKLGVARTGEAAALARSAGWL